MSEEKPALPQESAQEASQEGPNPELEGMAPFKVEGARSSRSKCKVCRKNIEKGVVRIGLLSEGMYGPGYRWHHLKCAARHDLEKVEEAYALECWDEGLEMPTLEELRQEAAKAAKKKAERKMAPYAERAPTGRSKCKHCNEPIEKGAWRVALLRSIAFGNQTRAGPVNVHPACVASEMRSEDCLSEPDEFADKLGENSQGVSPEEIQEVLDLVGILD